MLLEYTEVKITELEFYFPYADMLNKGINTRYGNVDHTSAKWDP